MKKLKRLLCQGTPIGHRKLNYDGHSGHAYAVEDVDIGRHRDRQRVEVINCSLLYNSELSPVKSVPVVFRIGKYHSYSIDIVSPNGGSLIGGNPSQNARTWR